MGSNDGAVVYQIVVDELRTLGVGPRGLSELRSSVLLRNGYCAGRGYRCGEWRVYWLVEENVVEFYAPGGELCRRLELEECGLRRAA